MNNYIYVGVGFDRKDNEAGSITEEYCCRFETEMKYVYII